ncbi:hypothetical protein FS749_003567 [Ceratobasidium sp. UAMH 11750]|nr:hypothetical protein FS749_003567 [Ceratobasidium sp. UAMH 11750]
MLSSLPRIRRILQPEDSSPRTLPSEQPQGHTEDGREEFVRSFLELVLKYLLTLIKASSTAPADPFEGLEVEPEPRVATPSDQRQETSAEKPPLPSKSTSDPTIEDVEFLRGIGREAQVWTTYVKETKEFDDDMVDGWNRSLDVTLVFAALFSAILTAFVLESAKQLEPDKEDQTVTILREISRTLLSNGAQNAPIGQSDPGSEAEFHPTRNAVWINCLWFLSLSLSIAVSLAAMLAKQWCYYYLSARNGDTITQAEERQKRYGGLAKWRMRGILEHLPMLMHIALALFSVGLILYLWDINVAVASTVSAVTVSALCFYLSTILLPVWDVFCPFKTTQSVYTRIILDRLAGGLASFREHDHEAQDPRAQAYAHRDHEIEIWALLKSFLSPFRTIKAWVARQITRPRLAQMRPSTQPSGSPAPENPVGMDTHSVIDITPHGSSDSDSLSLTSSDEEALPFVKDALEWLIFNSQKSSSIDTAIGALAIGKVRFENNELKHQIDLHLIKHFSDCFTSSREGVKLQLSHYQNALTLALDYVNWMTYFAVEPGVPAGYPPGPTQHPPRPAPTSHRTPFLPAPTVEDLSDLTQQVLEFHKSFGTELVTRLGLAFASLASQRTLSVDIGRKVALWLSSFIICYGQNKLYLSEEILSTLIDGLTIAGRNVDGTTSEDRVKILAIPQLISILWMVSHFDGSGLRSSIGLNLAVFALTTNLPYPIEGNNFRSIADHLAYDYHSREVRNASFISFVVFSLLGFVHPQSRLDLERETLETVAQIIHETRYLSRPGLSINVPKLIEPRLLRRRLTSMLVESTVKTPQSLPMPRGHLLSAANKSTEFESEWEERQFQSTMHAVHFMITSHLRGQVAFHDDVTIAATDLLYREVQGLESLDVEIIRSGAMVQGQSGITPPRENSAHEGTREPETPERMASEALALIMEKSNNKQCLETAVRAVLFHTKRCNVELAMQATRWFAKTFQKYDRKNVNEDRLLHMCGYVRILISMVSHCANPGDLAKSLDDSDEADSDVTVRKIVEDKLRLLSTEANDTHVRAFGVASLAMWQFGCLDKTYDTKTTQGALNDIWGLIVNHTGHFAQAQLPQNQSHETTLRLEAIEALIDTTTMFVAVTSPTARFISCSEIQALLRLLAQYRFDTKEPVRAALAVALTFWGLSLDADYWDFWTIEERKKCWRDYMRPKERNKDVAALLLLGLSRVLIHYEPLKLNHQSIKTIALEIDHYMHQHAHHPDTLTLPFLTGFDVRRHVRESVWTYLQNTESDGPFTQSTSASRNKLRSALQYEGGEGFWYEVPHPLARRPDTGRRVSFSSEVDTSHTRSASM